MSNLKRKCKICKKKIADVFIDYARMYVCSECFVKLYERKVLKTVRKFKMIDKNDVLGVAVSGGKDSMSLLYVSRTLLPIEKIKVLHINLGIGEYSRECEKVIRSLSKKIGVELILINLKKKYGFTLEDVRRKVSGKRICSLCGIIKRYVLNKICSEKGITKLATGHHLDDICKVLLKLYFQGDLISLARIKPVLPAEKGFVARVKPLCEITEKENLYYININKIKHISESCPLPYFGKSYRRQEELYKAIIKIQPNFRHIFFSSHVNKFLPLLEERRKEVKLRKCIECGQLTTAELCTFCKIRKMVMS